MDQKTDQVCNSMAEAAPLGMCCRVLQGLGVLQSFAIFQGVFCKVNTESNWCFGDMFFCWIPSVAIYHSVSLSPCGTKPCFAIACFALWAMLFRKQEKIHFLRSTRLFNQFHQLILLLILFISFTPFGYIVFQWDLYVFKKTKFARIWNPSQWFWKPWHILERAFQGVDWIEHLGRNGHAKNDYQQKNMFYDRVKKASLRTNPNPESMALKICVLRIKVNFIRFIFFIHIVCWLMSVSFQVSWGVHEFSWMFLNQFECVLDWNVLIHGPFRQWFIHA